MYLGINATVPNLFANINPNLSLADSMKGTIMAKRNRNKSTSQGNSNKLTNHGRGRGTGINYQPALRIQDVPSKGLVTRIKGWKTGRIHHFMSKLELLYFFILEWSTQVTDIREQYYLEQEITLAIAEKLNIRHPTNPRTKKEIVMTSDFVVTFRTPTGLIDHARTIKYAKDLRSARALEKLEIERLYWKAKGVDWGIVTEQEIDAVIAENVKWLHPYRDIVDIAPLSESVINQLEDLLTSLLLQEDLSLRDITDTCDEQFGLEAGSSLTAMRYLLANRRWLIDLSHPIQPSKILKLLTRA